MDEIDLSKEYNQEWFNATAALDLTEKIRKIGRLTMTCNKYRIKNENFDGLIEFLKNELNGKDVASVIVTM